MAYQMKGIKMAGGDETPMYTATIVRDGKRVGEVFNEGCGGPNGYRFPDNAEREAFYAFANAWATEQKEEYPDVDDWAYNQLQDWEDRKRMKRGSKTKTYFRLKGDEKDTWKFFRTPFSANSVIYIKERYGDKLEGIFDPSEAK